MRRVLVPNPFFYKALLNANTAAALKAAPHSDSVNKDGQGLREWTGPGVFHFPNGKLLAFLLLFLFKQP